MWLQLLRERERERERERKREREKVATPATLHTVTRCKLKPTASEKHTSGFPF
jgi:hypothetical protein